VQPVGLHHVALTVTNLDDSLTWYRRVLGMEEVFTEHSGSRRAVVLRFAGGDGVVGLVQHDPRSEQSFDPSIVGLDHLAFTVGSRADLDAWAQRLADQGILHSGAIDVPPGAILNFKDPDGIALSFFWDR
jgi:glyoxylase I family protein